MIEDEKLKIAELLLMYRAVDVCLDPPYKWTSGLRAPIYCNNRKMNMFPKARQTLIASFLKKMDASNQEFDVLAAVESAGTPWAAYVASSLQLPLVPVKPTPKEHGVCKSVQASVPNDCRIAVIEDLISTGSSSIKAIKAILRETKATVIGCWAIVDWQLDVSRQRFSQMGIKLNCLTDLEHILVAAKETGELQSSDLEIIRSFRSNPENWYQKFYEQIKES